MDSLLEDAMGTVGLSFGSPTSGTGFDVSATVSEIVANLQNVETPWKTQLSSLESQDTVISNLGSLMSNLSNDVSSLTDFDGILAQKTGSSSNTNVLELTSASSSATAGTHTVTVNSLASTSSGYLAEVSNSSAALSGQLTLQAGNGSAITFEMGAGSSTDSTIYTGSGNDTLGDLVSAINASGVGITANVEGDSAGSWLSLTSESSGAAGNISVSNNSIGGAGQILSYSGTAGTDGGNPTASTGTLTGVGGSDSLNGSISIQVGNGTAVTVAMSAVQSAEGGTTVADLATYLGGVTGLSGVTAGTTTNSDGSVSLTLTSKAPGSANTLTVTSSISDSSSTTLGYTSAVTGVDANLTIDGKSGIQSASNTVSNLIPGLTFQLLSSSSTPVQVVIGNDNTDIESTVNQFVSDYNSLISAINTQEGNTSSGTAEPLFGSPTLSLLQEQILGSVNTPNPNGYLDTIKNAGDTLAGSISFSLADGLPLYYSGTAGADADSTTGTSATTSTGTLAPIMNPADTLSGSISIQVGNGATQTINMSDVVAAEGGTTLNDLATYIDSTSNSFPFSAAVAANPNGDGSSILTLTSGTSGTAGSLTVTSNIADTSTQTVQVPTSSGQNTLAGLASAINAAYAGVTARVMTSSSGSQLVLESNFAGTSGALTVTSSITDTTTGNALNYNNGNTDINNLTSLGISANDDGTLTFDASSLDSILNTDYNSVVGFFQNANGWGQTFSSMLNNAGSSSSTGILSLASTSNSNIESSLNADISKENAMISAEQSSLTAELNSANEIMQQLPSELNGMNELYSAITGYQQNSNG
jgi:flagellar hook-associated protein 2